MSIELEKFQAKQQSPSVTTGVSALVLAVLIVVFYVLPKYNQLQQDNKDIEYNTQQLAQVDAQKTKALSAVDRIQQNQDALNSVTLAIPDQPGVPDLYAHLELLAHSSNLSLASVQAEDISAKAAALAGSSFAAGQASSGAGPTPTLGVIDIKTELRGTVDSLQTYLSAVEKSLRFIDVQSIDIARGQAQGGLAFHLELKSYYQKQ